MQPQTVQDRPLHAGFFQRLPGQERPARTEYSSRPINASRCQDVKMRSELRSPVLKSQRRQIWVVTLGRSRKGRSGIYSTLPSESGTRLYSFT